MEIIVESAALFTVASLVYIPLLVVQLTKGSATAYLYVQMFWAYGAVGHSYRSMQWSILMLWRFLMMKNFAPALIMLRVVLGRARPDSEWSAKVSGLHFASGPVGALAVPSSGNSRGVTSNIVTIPRIRGEIEYYPDIEEVQGSPDTSEFMRNGSESEIEEKV
jgi:hypothetical protein